MTATRRRRGEHGISFEHRGPCTDPERHRHCPGLWRGEITLGYTGDGKRSRRKVSGKTKAVVEKLRDLHLQLDRGTTPKTDYAQYTVRQAAEDWLASGLDGRSAKTVTKNQNVLEPILAVIGPPTTVSAVASSAASAAFSSRCWAITPSPYNRDQGPGRPRQCAAQPQGVRRQGPRAQLHHRQRPSGALTITETPSAASVTVPTCSRVRNARHRVRSVAYS